LRSRGKGGAVIRLRARNAVKVTDIRTTAGIHVSDIGEGDIPWSLQKTLSVTQRTKASKIAKREHDESET
jgi:hypothetical protein